MDDDDGMQARHTIDSRSGFITAVHEVLALATAQRARRMLWADGDFADWPLDDAQFLQRLTDWLRLPQRQLILLASDYRPLAGRARFVACHRLWSHAIAAYSPAEEDLAQLPCLLLADGHVLVRVLDKTRWRGWISSDPPMLRRVAEQTDALLQRSVPALAVTTLGL